MKKNGLCKIIAKKIKNKKVGQKRLILQFICDKKAEGSMGEGCDKKGVQFVTKKFKDQCKMVVKGKNSMRAICDKNI